VRAVETSDGSVVQEFPPRVKPHKVQIKPENLARVVEALHAVVNDPRGTAFPVRDPTLDVAGKTGTAQTGYIPQKGDDAKRAAYYSRDHAWFASFAPAKSPEIAVIVFIEHGGSGPTQAAPIGLQIIKDYERIQATRGPHLKPAPPPVLPKLPAIIAPPVVTATADDDAGPDAGPDEGGAP
jgi:penicillin-binding protein 2